MLILTLMMLVFSSQIQPLTDPNIRISVEQREISNYVSHQQGHRRPFLVCGTFLELFPTFLCCCLCYEKCTKSERPGRGTSFFHYFFLFSYMNIFLDFHSYSLVGALVYTIYTVLTLCSVCTLQLKNDPSVKVTPCSVKCHS